MNGNLCGVVGKAGESCGDDDKRARWVSGGRWVFDLKNLGGGAGGEIISGAGVFLGRGNSSLALVGFASIAKNLPPSWVVCPARAIGSGGAGGNCVCRVHGCGWCVLGLGWGLERAGVRGKGW